MTKQCAYCKQDFEASTDKGAYCSNQCRQGAYRVRTAELLKHVRASMPAAPKKVKKPKKIKPAVKLPVIKEKYLPRLTNEPSIDYKIRCSEYEQLHGVKVIKEPK